MDYSFLTRKSLADGLPPPENNEPVCTKDDPTGKTYKKPAFQPNTADGRVQSLTANRMTPKEQAESQQKFQRELFCERSTMSRIACNRPFLEVTGVEAGVSAGGWGTGVQTNGTLAGTEWSGVSKNLSPMPSAQLGLCVKIKGAKQYKHGIQYNAAAGPVYGGIDPINQSACFGGQFPPGLDAGVTVK